MGCSGKRVLTRKCLLVNEGHTEVTYVLGPACGPHLTPVWGLPSTGEPHFPITWEPFLMGTQSLAGLINSIEIFSQSVQTVLGILTD